jgi:homoserine kinase
VFARAPASSANLGPGFDCIALALSLYVEVEVHDAPSLTVTLLGHGAELAADDTNLAVQVATKVAGHDRLSITVRSDIPHSRGLGSSAAVALAAAAAAGADDPLGIAAALEGHPENAAASFRGGLVASANCEGSVHAAPLPLDPALRVVLVVPDHELGSTDARRELPEAIARDDVVFNLQHLGLLLSGLADLGGFARHATDDVLMQPWRAPLFPHATSIADELCGAGALGACWSGAGPSVLAIVSPATSARVADAGRRALRGAGLDGTVLEVAPDLGGLTWG